MTYSAALYDESDAEDDLERAQLRKLDFHVSQARASGAQRVLDVGCGWGSLLGRMVNSHGVQHTVGLTLSLAQAEQLGGVEDPRMEIRVEGWEEHEPDCTYDAVISIGAMEHFTKPDLSIGEKVERYRDFFLRCHRWTREGAWLSLQTCAYGWLRRGDLDTSFVAKEIFPESEFAHLSEIAKASEGVFEVVQLRNDRHDYARTCRDWLGRLRARWPEAVLAVGETTALKWERYLVMCVRGWETGATALLRIAFRRIDRPRL